MTIKPDKYIPFEYSLLGVASILNGEIHENDTVSSLWDRVQSDKKIRTFDRFADALTLLFAARLLNMSGGVLHRIDTSRAEP